MKRNSMFAWQRWLVLVLLGLWLLPNTRPVSGGGGHHGNVGPPGGAVLWGSVHLPSGERAISGALVTIRRESMQVTGCTYVGDGTASCGEAADSSHDAESFAYYGINVTGLLPTGASFSWPEKWTIEVVFTDAATGLVYSRTEDIVLDESDFDSFNERRLDISLGNNIVEETGSTPPQQSEFTTAIGVEFDTSGVELDRSFTGASTAWSGRWENVDPNTNGITVIEIRRQGNTLFVHSWGACSPTDCDHGEWPTPDTGHTLALTRDFGFKIETLVLTLASDNQMEVASFNIFTDDSGRPNYLAQHTFRKIGAPILEPFEDNWAARWENIDPNTDGITAIEISQTDNNLAVHTWGACVPTDCDHGIWTVANDAPAVTLVRDFGFKVETLTLIRVSETHLQAVSHNHFTDNSGRDDYIATYTFAKGHRGHLFGRLVEPDLLARWRTLQLDAAIPSNTSITATLLTSRGAPVTGFTDLPLTNGSNLIDLSGLDANIFSKLHLQLDLAASELGATPLLEGWRLTWDESTASPRQVTGELFDGHEHRLAGAKVTLQTATGTVVAQTVTNVEGLFVTPPVMIDFNQTYVVRVTLHHDPDGNFEFRVRHEAITSPLVYLETPAFSFVADTMFTTEVTYFDFLTHQAEYNTNISQADRLDDVAATYYHTSQVVNFIANGLGIPSWNPLDIVSYSPTATTYDESLGAYMIETSNADFDELAPGNRPMNREWHETFHHLMSSTIGMPPLPDCTPYYNHGGWNNCNTADSWLEGYATFWATILQDVLGEPNPVFTHVYQMSHFEDADTGLGPSLELNYRAWDPPLCDDDNTCLSREEFAVASLLWDLYDPVDLSGEDQDNLQVPLPTLWNVLSDTSISLHDMLDVYNALVASGIGQNPPPAGADSCWLNDLDTIFVSHGFFFDQNNSTIYDCNTVERAGVGRAANGNKPSRHDVPANDLILVVNLESDEQIELPAKLTVDVLFDQDYFNYSGELMLQKQRDNRIYLEMPPPHMPATFALSVETADGISFNVWQFTSEEFAAWAESTHEGNVIGEHTFKLVPKPVTACVNFQPADVPVPDGCLADYGLAFEYKSNHYTYGWQADISSSAHSGSHPDAPDMRYETWIRMQRTAVRDGVWEMALPDGLYIVEIAAGDTHSYHGYYQIVVEDQLLIDGKPGRGHRWLTGRAIVLVTDGRLTVSNAPGAWDNKLNFVTVQGISPITVSKRIDDGLQALYTFQEKSGSVVNDISGVGTPLDLIIEEAMAVTWLPHGGLRLNQPTRLLSAGPSTKLITSAQASDAFTIEMWLDPTNMASHKLIFLLSLADYTERTNMTLTQKYSRGSPSLTTYGARIYTTTSSPNERTMMTTPLHPLGTSPTHLVLAVGNGSRVLFLNGIEVARQPIDGGLSSWNPDNPLVVGNALNGERPWLGDLYLVAFYDRALTLTEVYQNYTIGPPNAEH